MKTKVFVDGKEGTTGLQIFDRLAKRDDLTILQIPEEKRKDLSARTEFLNEADVAFLCLPDVAAREAVSLIKGNTKIIDASTAHRTHPDFVYGLPELSPSHRERIRSSSRIANPGCHATGFNLIVYPLVHNGITASDYAFTCQSLTGYSGGGKKMISEYEAKDRSPLLSAPRLYALGLTHKHLPEMQTVCELDFAPLFVPVVGDFACGMLVSVPLVRRMMKKGMSAWELYDFYKEYYQNEKYIRVMPFGGEDRLDNGFLTATDCNGTNFVDLFVFGGEENVYITARFDNLGKGASGAAVQCLNILLGYPQEAE